MIRAYVSHFRREGPDVGPCTSGCELLHEAVQATSTAARNSG